MSATNTKLDAVILEIAKKHFHVDTLQEQKSGADFHEVAVWSIEAALRAAYEAGKNAK